MAAKKAEAAPPRLALFVEGTTTLTAHGRDSLRELWRHQCTQVSAVPADRIDVYGFSKQQLLLMMPGYAGHSAGKVSLDIHVERTFKEKPFAVLVVAFDAHPADAAITLVEGVPCLRLERDFLLERFAASAFLPQPFRARAAALLAHYQNHRAQPRNARRPPMGELEVVYMDPVFESMVLQDASALRKVFALKKAPNTWPALPFTGDRPDFAFRSIVDDHHRHGPTYLRVPYDSDKHAWAHEVLRNADPGSAIWRHPIVRRLAKALSGLA